MYAKALEIAWHESKAVWSVDLSSNNRLLTAGGDKVARVWRITDTPYASLTRPTPTRTLGNDAEKRPEHVSVEWLCDLRAHTTTVNVARFSRDANTIATGSDGGEIVLWTRGDLDAPALGDDPAPKERWARLATLRGHVQDVLDLAWAADASRLVSASVDNSVKVWDVRNPAKPPVTLRSHTNFVQGVSIDPFGRLIASLGNDRALRVFTSSASNAWYQVASVSSALDPQDTRLFIDDANFHNCFRRLAWSPDGSVVACPSAIQYPHAKRFAVHLFARNSWVRPAAQCGGFTKPACAVRFSPVLYALRGGLEKKKGAQNSSPDSSLQEPPQHPFVNFKYRMLFAVLCVDSVLFYDTEALTRPFAMVEGLHCAQNTDISWSRDGLTAAISSVDGYVSFVCFTREELGKELAPEHTPPWLICQEQIEQPQSGKSPRKPKPIPVTVVQPRSASEAPPPEERVQMHFPPPPVLVKPIDTTADNTNSLPVSLPLPDGEDPAKPMVSASASTSKLPSAATTIVRTANGGQRVSIGSSANEKQSLSAPTEQTPDTTASVPKAAAAENAMKAAMSEMMEMENSRSDIESLDGQKEQPPATTNQHKSDAQREVPSIGLRLLTEERVGQKDMLPSQREESQDKKPDSSPMSSSKAISVDPESPLKADASKSRASNTLRRKLSLATLSQHLANSSVGTPPRSSDQPEPRPKLIMAPGRPKSGKVQTTLSCFQGLGRKPSEKSSQRQNVPQDRTVTSDDTSSHCAPSPIRKLDGSLFPSVALPSHARDIEQNAKRERVGTEIVTNADSGEAKRRKLAERPANEVSS